MWPLVPELLAEMIEEVSLLVAQRVRSEPREVTRPGLKEAQAKHTKSNLGLHAKEGGGFKAVGLQGMLSLARLKGGQVNPSA